MHFLCYYGMDNATRLLCCNEPGLSNLELYGYQDSMYYCSSMPTFKGNNFEMLLILSVDNCLSCFDSPKFLYFTIPSKFKFKVEI